MKKAQQKNSNEFATKQDLNKSFNDLAGMISRGFDMVEGKITEVDERLTKQMDDFRIEVKNEFRQVHGILIQNHEKRIVALEKKTARI